MLSRAALFLLACAGTAAFAQGAPPPALDEGAGRAERLLEGAKREGSLSVYASMAEKDLMRLGVGLRAPLRHRGQGVALGQEQRAAARAQRGAGRPLRGGRG